MFQTRCSFRLTVCRKLFLFVCLMDEFLSTHCFLYIYRSNNAAVCPLPLTQHLAEHRQTVKSFVSHFLVLDLPKIALTGDINGLLLASSSLLQIFWKHKTQENEKKKERKRKWKSSTHHFSEEIASLFDSLPESVPPIENCPADVVAERRLQRKEPFMRGTSILGLSVSEPWCSVRELQPNLSTVENSVLFPAQNIFRLKPISNE